MMICYLVLVLCLIFDFCFCCRWDDPYGPVILTVFLILTLLVQFVLKVAAMYKEGGNNLKNSPGVASGSSQ